MKKTRALLPLMLVCLAAPAAAQSRGEWTLGVGAHTVNPTSDNGSLSDGTLDLDIGSDWKPSVTAEYFIRDNLGIEVLAAWPFEHDISIDGLGKVGSTKHLPPTVSLQYHFNASGKVSPFLGAGLNYTTFFSEETSGALAGSELKLADSWGLAVHAGLDILLSDKNALRIDARWIDIDSDVSVDGVELGTAHIDPMVYGVAWVHKF